jgi:uroporphyrinogen-III decarboxylase
MTSRDRVMTTFAHEPPDRVPAWCGSTPEFWAKAKRELHIDDDEQLFVRFGNRMVFNGAIDSHHVLIDGTPDLVRTKTREVLEIMKPGGGYIAGASHDSILEETPVENVVAMFDAIREFGSY